MTPEGQGPDSLRRPAIDSSRALRWPAVGGDVSTRRRIVLPRVFAAAPEWASDMAREQIRALAVHILARCGEGDFRTIAVTSALAGEGKTSVAMAVAERLARAGRRVLLVDLDLHRRTLTQLLGLEGVPGAAEAVTKADVYAVSSRPTLIRRGSPFGSVSKMVGRFSGSACVVTSPRGL